MDLYKNSEISESKPLKITLLLRQTVVLTPKPLKILANSRAMYPAPTIKICFGNTFKSNAESESMQYSAPSHSSNLGLPPAAIKIYLEFIIFFLFKRILLLSPKEPQLLKTFTPELINKFL